MNRLLLLSLLLAACSAPPSGSNHLGGTHWQLVEVRQADGTVVPASGEPLRFDARTVWFQSVCNTCSVGYSMTGDVLRTGTQITCTEMACPPTDPTPSTLLPGPMRVMREGDELRLEPVDAAVRQVTLVFRRADG